MSVVITNVVVVNPIAMFDDNIKLDIEFECTASINDYLKWEVSFIVSSTGDKHDQILTTVFVGPVEIGVNRFVLESSPPKKENIPYEDIGIGIIMLKGYYKEQEFIRIGHFASHKVPPEATSFDQVDWSTVEREIIDNAKVQTTVINWK